MTKIGCVFPGQGSQHVGMAREVVENNLACERIMSEADRRLGFGLSELMFTGPEALLKETENAQPALLTASVACFELLKAHGIEPAVVAGHSLGEYAALVVAGAIGFSDAVWLVRQRGLYMKEAVPSGEGGMVAILGLGAAEVQALCDHCRPYGLVEMANFNCPGQIVVSGEVAALEKVVAYAKDFGAKRAITLVVSGPFHCSMLTGAGERLEKAMAQVTFSEAKIPVIANCSGEIVAGKEEIAKCLVKQVSSPVLWEQTIRKMLSDGVEVIIEVGAGKVLSGLMKKIAPEVTVLNVEDMASFKETVSALQLMG